MSRSGAFGSSFARSSSYTGSMYFEKTSHVEGKSPEDIIRDYFIIPGTQEVLTQRTIIERQHVIEEVEQLSGPMRHLSEEEKELILKCITSVKKGSGGESETDRDQPELKEELIEKLVSANGNFNTLSQKERDRLIKMIHVNEMIENDCPNSVDLEVVAGLYDENQSEDYGLIVSDKTKDLIADLRAPNGPLSCLTPNVRKALIKCLQCLESPETLSKKGQLSKSALDDVILRIHNGVGEFKRLDAESKDDLVKMLILRAGGISMEEMSTAAQINLVKGLRTAKGELGMLDQTTRLKIINQLKESSDSSETGRMSMLQEIRRGTGQFSQLSKSVRSDMADFLDIAARRTFIKSVTRKKQENALKDLEKKALSGDGKTKGNINTDDLESIKNHLAPLENDGEKLKTITVKDRDHLIQRLEKGQICKNITKSEREMIVHQLNVSRKKAVQKVLKTQEKRKKSGKNSEGFSPFGSGDETLGEIIERAREAGENWDELLVMSRTILFDISLYTHTGLQEFTQTACFNNEMFNASLQWTPKFARLWATVGDLPIGTA